MVILCIVAGVIFLVITLLTVKLSWESYRKENSERMWKLWGMRTMYWQGVIIISSGLTILTMLLLKWSNILVF